MDLINGRNLIPEFLSLQENWTQPDRKDILIDIDEGVCLMSERTFSLLYDDTENNQEVFSSPAPGKMWKYFINENWFFSYMNKDKSFSRYRIKIQEARIEEQLKEKNNPIPFIYNDVYENNDLIRILNNMKVEGNTVLVTQEIFDKIKDGREVQKNILQKTTIPGLFWKEMQEVTNNFVLFFVDMNRKFNVMNLKIKNKEEKQIDYVELIQKNPSIFNITQAIIQVSDDLKEVRNDLIFRIEKSVERIETIEHVMDIGGKEIKLEDIDSPPNDMQLIPLNEQQNMVDIFCKMMNNIEENIKGRTDEILIDQAYELYNRINATDSKPKWRQ